MTLKMLKGLQVTVGVCVLGILASFAMCIVTAVQHHRAETQINPAAIPTPATAVNQ
jgi:hypothetical protein